MTVGNFLGSSLFVGLPMPWISGRRATRDWAIASSANSAPSIAVEAQAQQAQA
jgi:hypothetical protein